MRATQYGVTAVYSRGLARKSLARLAWHGLSILLLTAAVAGFLLTKSSLLLPSLLVAVPTGVVVGLGLRRENILYLKAHAGIVAEERVAKALSKLPVVAVVNGVLLHRGDVDHVVLGPMVAAIETKHGSGQLSLDASGVLCVRGRRLPRDPVAQAAASAVAVGKILGRPAVAVLVVVDAAGPVVRVGNVYVTSLANINGCLAQLPQTLTADVAKSLVHLLPVAQAR